MLGPLVGGGLLLEFSGACDGGGPPKFPPGRPPGGPVPLGGKGGAPTPGGPPPGGPPGGNGGGPTACIQKCENIAPARRTTRESAWRTHSGREGRSARRHWKTWTRREWRSRCRITGSDTKNCNSMQTHVHQTLEGDLRNPWAALQTQVGDRLDVEVQIRNLLGVVLRLFRTLR
jgi:hypothetical protein